MILIAYFFLFLVPPLSCIFPVKQFLLTDIKQLLQYGRPETQVVDLVAKKEGEYYFKFYHLTDLHFTADEAIEAPLSKDVIFNRNLETFRWAAEDKDSYILLTGDITDQGLIDEWDQFNSVLDKFDCQLKSGNTLVVPGNHDLSMSNSKDPITTDIHALYEFEIKTYNFINNVIIHCPNTWKFMDEEEWVPLSDKIKSLTEYKALYDKNKPKIVIDKGDELNPKTIDYKIEFPYGYYSKMEKHIDESFWPTKDEMFYHSLLKRLYPMILLESEKFIVVGLNSSLHYSKSMAWVGFGSLGNLQLQKFELISKKIAQMGKTMIVLVHHHISIPKSILKELKEYLNYYQIRSLQSKDAYALANIIKKYKCFVFHGHKHISYCAKIGDATIISGPSTAFGDKRGLENAYQYGISNKLELVELDKSYIADN